MYDDDDYDDDNGDDDGDDDDKILGFLFQPQWI